MTLQADRVVAGAKVRGTSGGRRGGGTGLGGPATASTGRATRSGISPAGAFNGRGGAASGAHVDRVLINPLACTDPTAFVEGFAGPLARGPETAPSAAPGSHISMSGLTERFQTEGSPRPIWAGLTPESGHRVDHPPDG